MTINSFGFHSRWFGGWIFMLLHRAFSTFLFWKCKCGCVWKKTKRKTMSKSNVLCLTLNEKLYVAICVSFDSFTYIVRDFFALTELKWENAFTLVHWNSFSFFIMLNDGSLYEFLANWLQLKMSLLLSVSMTRIHPLIV